ncbi:MAG: hypothetical protein JOZ88_12965 [Hyphomicrobiales bacterium]|nr:hypothetical protein [Hyphomicrobiales bacterium]
MQIDFTAEALHLRRAPKSDALRWFVSITAALVAAIWVCGMTARAAQREARLVEMARPDCIHSGVTNKELRHLVRGEVDIGANEREALRSVVTLCQAKQRGA